VFGTDWPYDMALDWPVAWILAMESLSSEEKDAIPWKNLATLLDL
jgi:predicted TIM-barrel fold metal-dependent hydrolase